VQVGCRPLEEAYIGERSRVTPIESNQDHTESEAPEKTGFGKQQVIGTIVTLAVLVIVFAVVFPQFADYQQAWDAIQQMSAGWIVALIVATVVVITVYVWPFQAALPGLKYGPGFVVRQTSFMISNVIPMGGAIGLGVQYGMLNGYGYGPAPATAAIGITSVWNTFITLSLPVIGLLGLIVIGEATTGAALAALFGVAAIVAGIVLFVIILRSEERARNIGAWADRVVTWAAGLINKDVHLGIDQALVGFRDSIVDVVSDRWALVTGTNLLQQLAQFSVLFVAILAIQGGRGEIGLIMAFAAFSFGRLATFIPIPPGGLGTTDAIITSVLTAFGMSSSDALAADLVWRAATYFPQVFIGIGTFLYWRRRQRKAATAG
jgi:putative heme transporter